MNVTPKILNSYNYNFYLRKILIPSIFGQHKFMTLKTYLNSHYNYLELRVLHIRQWLLEDVRIHGLGVLGS